MGSREFPDHFSGHADLYARLQHAPSLPNVTYRQNLAQLTGEEAGSCQLLTAAQAAHWFDWPARGGVAHPPARRLQKPRRHLLAFRHAKGRLRASGPLARGRLRGVGTRGLYALRLAVEIR
jgi:hypothetical protein